MSKVQKCKSAKALGKGAQGVNSLKNLSNSSPKVIFHKIAFFLQKITIFALKLSNVLRKGFYDVAKALKFGGLGIML